MLMSNTKDTKEKYWNSVWDDGRERSDELCNRPEYWKRVSSSLPPWRG